MFEVKDPPFSSLKKGKRFFTSREEAVSVGQNANRGFGKRDRSINCV